MPEKLEQHIGTVLQFMVMGLLAWSLKTNVDTSTQIAGLTAKVDALQSVVNQGTTDRYRGSDAARDFGAVWAELNRHENRIIKIEERRK